MEEQLKEKERRCNELETDCKGKDELMEQLYEQIEAVSQELETHE